MLEHHPFDNKELIFIQNGVIPPLYIHEKVREYEFGQVVGRIKKPRNFRYEAFPSFSYVTVVAQRVRGLTEYHSTKIGNFL